MSPLVSAHRGGPEGRYVPNSLAAIEAAVRVGVDLVEFDVRRAPDGSFVIRHDRFVPMVEPALTTVRGSASVPSDGAGAPPPGAGPNGAVPSEAPLRDVLAVMRRGSAVAHVDLKDVGDEVEIAELCLERLGAAGFVVTTGSDAGVRRLRAALPQVGVGLSLGRGLPFPPTPRAVGAVLADLFPGGRVDRCSPTMLAVQHRLARAGLLRWATRRGIPVLAWTVNSRPLIEWASNESRLWAFTTDHPRLALSLRGNFRGN